MAPAHHIGQRTSFDSHLCTVRYIGPVAGTQKEWLGVEWDDFTRGKHDGEHEGVKYFTCRSGSGTAASFVRPTRIADLAQSFVEAVHQKYAFGITERRDALAEQSQIEISGKVVEEVGFDKIRQQLAQLHELRIVIVDGMRIAWAGKTEKMIREACPKIVELDLSRNLFENYEEITTICRELSKLRVLRLNGNRLQLLSEHFRKAHLQDAFKGIAELSLDEMLVTWEDICHVVATFPDLISLTADSNDMRSLHTPMALLKTMSTWNIKSLNLDYNSFTSLGDISPLVDLPCLETLRLKGNQIIASTDRGRAKPAFGIQLQYIDLSYNKVTTWNFVDELPDVFPGLTALRFSHNPIYEHPAGVENTAAVIEEGYMLTLARIANLKVLNFSNITPGDRTNAEMFYLSRIGKAIANVPESEEHLTKKQHRRYDELCALYGAPTVVRVTQTVNPAFLEARLIKFTFYMPPTDSTKEHNATTVTIVQEIPKGFDIYQVKGIVGRLFGLRPLSLRLVWETGEWDPVAGYEDQEEESDEENDLEGSQIHEDAIARDPNTDNEQGRWMRREVELEDGTRQVGFWVNGLEAKVRVELLPGKFSSYRTT